MYYFIPGANTSGPHLHGHPIDVPSLSVGDQVLLFNVHTVPSHVGGDDRHQEVPGLHVHSAGAEDLGRHHARNDEEEPR